MESLQESETGSEIDQPQVGVGQFNTGLWSQPDEHRGSQHRKSTQGWGQYV